jgi:hypothetical protein
VTVWVHIAREPDEDEVMAAESDQSKRPQAKTIDSNQRAEADSHSVACDACCAPMRPMGHCKYWCLRCGFMRTCNDVI